MDFGVPEIACILEAGDTSSRSYTTKYFNLLRRGTYRIKTEFNFYDELGGSGNTYATFSNDGSGDSNYKMTVARLESFFVKDGKENNDSQ